MNMNEFKLINVGLVVDVKVNLVLPVAICHVLFSWMSCARLRVSQPSNGASCQSTAETNVTMAAVVMSVAAPSERLRLA